jgi:radical SAM protein with 4Fe4S-binding SPASM domain
MTPPPASQCLHDPAPLEGIYTAARKAGVPLYGSLALTHRCNLHCAHCYLDTAHRSPELATDGWKRVIDGCAELGCLFLLLTGGEPLAREDFTDLYTYARERGLVLSVFTNGTLIDDTVLDCLADSPPRHVEISVYGASPQTYAAVTGDAGGYEACMAGIERLRSRGIRVKLKTLVTQANRADFEAIEALATRWGVGFRFDAVLVPRLHGDRAPVQQRVAPEEAVALDFAKPERAREWARLHERTRDAAPSGRLFACGAAVSTFHVTPAGRLQPCIMTGSIQYDLQRTPFALAWRRMADHVSTLAAPENYRCGGCELRALCGLCPPLAALETGNPGEPVPYLCALGEGRLACILSG